MELNRRNFLRLTGVGVAGSLISVNAGAKTMAAKSLSPIAKPEKIIYRKLGKTGITLPVVSMGVMRVDNENIINAAYEAGIRHFDTAHSYQGGKSEEMLGQILKSRKRDSFVVATKISTRNTVDPEKELTDSLELSLKRLQMDYVDILYLHGVNKRDDVLNEKILKTFQKFKAQGKAKFIGVSTHSNMPEVIRAVVESKVWDVVLTTYNFLNMKNPADVKKAAEEAHNAGIGLIAMKTVAGSGYWDRERTKKINATAALKWALQDEFITTSIPGVTSFEQLQENVKVMSDITLTAQEKQDLKIDSAITGLFCLGCEQCLAQCPNNAPIPDMMRAYMYAYGCRDTKMARDVIDQLPEAKKACTLCPTCNVECTLGFAIQDKAKDILRIESVPREFLV
ncbi:MAG: aldo/keto reductase [Bacteroidota bacterium]|nr:aldo/keto reductase [Bacteroidota bacterium]